jgi:hypothetical protein
MRLVLAILTFVICLNGCNGNAGTQGAQVVQIAQPGNVQSFIVTVTNNTQFPGYIIITANGGAFQFGLPTQPGTGIVVYPGNVVQTDVGFLPNDVEVDMALQTNPLYVFPTKTFLIGRDFNYWNGQIDVSFP